jgi:hypothetical protein
MESEVKGMDEKAWVVLIVNKLTAEMKRSSLIVEQGKRLPYAYEILSYDRSGVPHPEPMEYETDILISESFTREIVKPIIVIEAKVEGITTHNAITYSEKALAHKQVHPYLRYGIILGGMKKKPLPGRLFRHGTTFDFMQSFAAFKPSETEWKSFVKILWQEAENSRLLYEVIYNSRSKRRKAFTSFAKELHFK